MTVQKPFIVKVCGVTMREDAQAALDAGANALGFNFYPKSPRFLSAEKAATILAALHGDFLRVGVFVNPTDEDLSATSALLDIAQIHGSGKTHLPIWKAIAAGTPPVAEPGIDAYLVDTFTPQFGGSGKTFDWSLAANFPHRAIIAGGLDGSNVAQAIQLANPWGVDSCSRLESAPGRKDHNKVAAFVAASLQAFQLRQAVHI